MKKLILFSVYLSALCILTSCKEECGFIDNPVCSETAPTDEDCRAYFNRWFYNSETNTCQQIGYSGCNSKGFDIKEECESCSCH